MPLGAGVDHDDPRHKSIVLRWERARALVDGWIERLRAEGSTDEAALVLLAEIKRNVFFMEEELRDYYWQSSSAECPEDNEWISYEAPKV